MVKIRLEYWLGIKIYWNSIKRGNQNSISIYKHEISYFRIFKWHSYVKKIVRTGQFGKWEIFKIKNHIVFEGYRHLLLKESELKAIQHQTGWNTFQNLSNFEKSGRGYFLKILGEGL